MHPTEPLDFLWFGSSSCQTTQQRTQVHKDASHRSLGILPVWLHLRQSRPQRKIVASRRPLEIRRPWLDSHQMRPGRKVGCTSNEEKQDASHQTTRVHMVWLRSRREKVQQNERMHLTKPLEFPCLGCILTKSSCSNKAGCSKGAVHESLTPSSYAITWRRGTSGGWLRNCFTISLYPHVMVEQVFYGWAALVVPEGGGFWVQ